MKIPAFLQTTYLMLTQAFPDGVSEEYYWIILYLLYNYMADENLTLVMSFFSGKPLSIVANDVYGVSQMKFDSKLLEEVKSRLVANGFDEWKNN